MLEAVKVYLRINHNEFDDEVQDLIDACLLDLETSGIASSKLDVKNIEAVDPLIKRAITTYCKANFGYDNPDFDKLTNAYEMLKKHLTLSLDYNEGDEDVA